MSTTPMQRILRSNSLSNTSSSVTLPEMKTLIDKMKKNILDTLMTEVDKQTSLVKELVKKVEDLNGRNAQLEERCLKLEDDMKTVATSIFEELDDRGRRKRNLIISGIPESTEGTAEERKEADREKVKSILYKLSLEEGDIVARQNRIGRVNEGRNRLLKIVCHGEESKFAVLRRSKVLRDSAKFQNIYINADLTSMQRNERKRLRDEFKRRRALGEDVALHYGRIVSANDRNFH